ALGDLKKASQWWDHPLDQTRLAASSRIGSSEPSGNQPSGGFIRRSSRRKASSSGPSPQPTNQNDIALRTSVSQYLPIPQPRLSSPRRTRANESSIASSLSSGPTACECIFSS